MALTIELPTEYSYIIAVASSSFLVNLLHFYLTATARKASGLKYPIPYASQEQAEKDPKAFKFNCAQRAHANFLENHTSFLGGLLITGLRYPTFAWVAGATWVSGRILYALGYTSAGPQGRIFGFTISSFADLGLRLAAAFTSYKLIMS